MELGILTLHLSQSLLEQVQEVLAQADLRHEQNLYQDGSVRGGLDQDARHACPEVPAAAIQFIKHCA